jgi:multidrug efflux pump subunit AcrA (membrane-fusion protein)
MAYSGKLIKFFITPFIWCFLLFILVIIYKPDLVWEKTSTEKPKKAEESVWVTTSKVLQKNTRKILSTTGSFKGLETISILPKAEGRVQKLFHDIGDEVLPGEPLLQIDETDSLLNVSETKKSLELELSRLGLTSLPQSTFDLRKLPAVAKAEILEKNSVAKQERFRRLGTASSMEDRDQTETEARVARANLDTAILDAQTSLATIHLKQALLETSMQKLQDCKILTPKIDNPGGKDFTSLLSSSNPIPFVVFSRGISVGEMAKLTPQEPLFKLVIDRILKLHVALPEKDFSLIKNNQHVKIEVEAFPDRVFDGTVKRISPAIDPLTRTFQVEIGVPNPNRELRPGFFGKAKIEIAEKPSALLVPEEAIIQFAGINKVFRIHNNIAQQVDVNIIQRITMDQNGLKSNLIEVESSLRSEDQIIISGQNNLHDGCQVQIRPEKTANK